MSVVEQCLRFDCAGQALIGVLSRPQQPSGVGVVVVVGGPQYRAGSHRQFVLLARHLAAAGHAVLRFDYRGMGDSGGDRRDFESVSDDIDAAIRAMQQAVPGVRQVALWGLCDGASAALLYLHAKPDAPVAGLCLLNPWVRSAQSQATAQVKHYYIGRIMEREFWLKLLSGGIGFHPFYQFMRSIRTMLASQPSSAEPSAAASSFQRRMALAWRNGKLPMLLVLSGRDLTAKEFTEAVCTDPLWRGALAHPRLTRLNLDEADHTFSDQTSSQAMTAATSDWLDHLNLTLQVGSGSASHHAG